MEKTTRTIRELISDVTTEFERLGYSKLSIHTGYTIPWKRFLRYADERGEQYFSESLGERYLSEFHQYPQNYSGKLPDRVKRDVRSVRVLGDFQAHHTILRCRGRVDKALPQAFKFLNPTIDEFATLREYSKSSIKRMKETLHTFFGYIDGNRIETLNGITAEHISGFIASQTGYSNLSVCRDMGVLRMILKFFYERGLSENDLSEYVPRIKRLRNQKLPSYWDKETVDKLLGSVDRGNPMGKRDYAILLFAVRYGIRSCDIMNLKLSDIDWDAWQIKLRQIKTGGLLCLPLLGDIVLSLIDYYRYGRPKTACQNIFVRHCAPYNEFYALTHFGRYFSRAGIDVSGHKHGLHSLRHTLASRLLAENVDILTIAGILGHVDIHTTNDYIHIDIEYLKQCALETEAWSGSSAQAELPDMKGVQ